MNCSVTVKGDCAGKVLADGMNATIRILGNVTSADAKVVATGMNATVFVKGRAETGAMIKATGMNSTVEVRCDLPDIAKPGNTPLRRCHYCFRPSGDYSTDQDGNITCKTCGSYSPSLDDVTKLAKMLTREQKMSIGAGEAISRTIRMALEREGLA